MQYNKETNIVVIVQNIKLNAGTERAALKLTNLLNLKGYKSSLVGVESVKITKFRVLRWIKSFINILNLIITTNRAYPETIFIGTGHFINVSLITIKLFISIKVIACEHLPYKSKTFLQKVSSKILYPKLDKLVLLTKRDSEDYSKNIKKVVVPNSIDKFFLEAKKTNSNRKYIIVGRICFQKGSDLIPNIIETLSIKDPESELYIIGDGDSLDSIINKVRNSNYKYHFFKELQNNIVKEKIFSSNVLLLPSRYEGFPFVILESFSSGTPVVAFDCHTGPKEMIINDNVGYVVPMYDIDMMISKAMYMAEETISNKKLIENSCLFEANKYSSENVADQWVVLISELIQ